MKATLAISAITINMMRQCTEERVIEMLKSTNGFF